MMDFIIPKRRYMNSLYRLTRKIFRNNFFDFVDKLGQRIFFVTSNIDNIVVIITPQENKIDVFYGEDGLISCHNLLSGDKRGVHTYGVSSICVEEINEKFLCGCEYYLGKFKHYNFKGKAIGYVAYKPGQKPIVIEDEEAKILINVLKKLLLIQKQIEKKNEFVHYDDEMVCIYDFNSSKRKFDTTYTLLETFDFLPKISIDSEVLCSFNIESTDIKSGILHIGQINAFNTCEIYDRLNLFDVALTPIYLYSLTEDGEINHIIYSAPKCDYNRVSAFILSKFFEDVGLYDTVITDNYLIYNALYQVLESKGVELKYDPDNDFNTFITKFMIKMSQLDSDVNAIDEALNSNKEDLKELILNSIDNLAELNENFFNENDEEDYQEEDSEDESNDEITSETNTYIS